MSIKLTAIKDSKKKNMPTTDINNLQPHRHFLSAFILLASISDLGRSNVKSASGLPRGWNGEHKNSLIFCGNSCRQTTRKSSKFEGKSIYFHCRKVVSVLSRPRGQSRKYFRTTQQAGKVPKTKEKWAVLLSSQKQQPHLVCFKVSTPWKQKLAKILAVVSETVGNEHKKA